MTVEAEIYDRLSGHAGLSALVINRIYPNHVPQNVTLPAVSYHRVSAVRPSAMGADSGVVRARFQVDVWASSFADASGARPVAEQVRLALQRWSTTSGTIVQETFFLNERDLYEDRRDLHHAALDFEINYEE